MGWKQPSYQNLLNEISTLSIFTKFTRTVITIAIKVLIFLNLQKCTYTLSEIQEVKVQATRVRGAAMK
jgi:hypothetical protein